MKTQNNKLNFKKNSIVELNDDSMNSVNGGSTLTSIIIASIVASIIVSIVTREVAE
jgi:hypothetical protein